MKILVAEDNEMTAEILQLHLRKHGFEAILASNGVEALECLESIRDISLVVTDLMMPELDGFGLVSEMRRRLELSDIPVVVVSARAEPELVTKAAELGCRQFVVKPVHDANLVKAIRTALNDQRNLLRPQHEVLEQLGIDSQTYRKLVGRFAVLADAVITKLEESLAGQENPKSGPEQADLARLLESANLLGADRVAQVIDRLAKENVSSNGNNDTSQRRLLLRELTLLLSTMRARSVPSTERRKQEPAPDASEEREQEELAGGRSLDIKKRVVRVS